MPKLNDTQLILLSTAAQRDGGSLLPLPDTLADAGDRATKAIAALIKRSLAEELPFRRRERAMLRFRQMKSLRKFASVHANVRDHFSLERHLIDRQTFK